MFRHVIVGVDGKSSGRDAIALGARLADRDGRLSLAHVEPGESVPRRASSLDFDRVQREESLTLLEREREAAGVRAQLLHKASESIGRGLHLLAEEHEGDLLVVGSCHRGRAGRVLLGDNARDTLIGSPCPVAIAPSGYAGCAHPFGNIGVAYDGSPHSREALAVGRRLARREDASVRALRVLSRHVAPFMIGYGSMWAKATEIDVKAARDDLDVPPEVERDVVLGVAAERLAQFSTEVDVLAVGSREHGPLGRVLLGSTSQQLAHTAGCPLLVVAHDAARVPVGSGSATSATAG